MKWICEVTERPVKAKDCIRCAWQATGCPVAAPGLLKALANSLRDDEALAAVKAVARIPVIRVTSLVGCRRKAWYDARPDEYQRPPEKPSQMWARLRGVIFHKGMENGDEGEEMRLFARVTTPAGEAIIAGRVDHYDEETGTLYDYKTINTWKRLANFNLPKPHHVFQLHVYAWLLGQQGKHVNRMRLVYLTMGESLVVDVPASGDLTPEIRDTVASVVDSRPPPATPREEWECRYCPWVQCPAHPEHHSDDIEDDIFA